MKAYSVQVTFEGTKGRAYSFNVAPNIKMELGRSYHIVAKDATRPELPANNYRNAAVKVVGISLDAVAGFKTIFRQTKLDSLTEKKLNL